MTPDADLTDRRLALRHLVHFLAVVERGSITGAAQTLIVAASGVSQTIAELESHLGVRLFERGRSGSQPTAAGLALVGPARRALGAFDEATTPPGESSDAPPSHLSVISTPSLVQEPTSPLLGALHQRLPGVRIVLAEPTGATVADAVQPVLAGAADVAVTELPEGTPPGARVVRLRDLEYHLVCPPGTRQSSEGAFEVAEILDIGLVVAPLFESSEVYRRLAGVEPRIDQAIVVRTEHRDALMMLARSGAGAVLLDAGRAERAAQLGCVVGRLVGVPPRRIAAVARADRSSPALEEFLSLCRADRARANGGERGRS